MLKNYIKIAARNLLRRKSYSALNIIGLSTGLACVIFIANWVIDEMSYDQHFTQADQIHRVVSEAGSGTDRWHQTVTAMPLGPQLKEMYPEVETYVRLDNNDALIVKGNKQFIEENIVLTDPDFFDMFDVTFLKGSAENAISSAYKIVLTASTAEKYFGEEDPIGQSLKIFSYDPEGRGEDYEVTGVIPDPIATSHFTYNIIASISTMEAAFSGAFDNWGNNSYYTYIKLIDGASPLELEEKFPLMLEHISKTDNVNLNNRFYLQPIESIYLHSDILYEFQANGSVAYIWIFSSIGIFILLLAGINYINLSTSVALERSKETGVRKVLGAYSSNLIRQHLIETLVLTLFSIIVAGLLVEIFKSSFYNLTDKHHIVFDRLTLGLQLLVIGIPIGLIAGYIPAFFLARLQTISALKGTIDKNSKSGLRSVLVTLQFAVTLVILVGLMVVHQQLDFVQSKDLGYDKSNILTVRVNGDENVKQGFDVFKNDLLASSQVVNVAKAGSIISSGLGNSNGRVTDSKGDMRVEKLNRLSVGYDYIDTYKMEMVAGKDFDPKVNIDSIQAFIINESTASVFGWTPEEAIGQDMRYSGMQGVITGVVKDFHYNSLHHDIEPMCMYIRKNFSRIIIKGKDTKELLATVTSAWKKHYPSAIYDYQFQDQALFDTYQSDQRFGAIFNIFSALSMLIAFLGLFGLVGYTVAKRAKEIGIRKVLGASSRQVLYILSMKFLQIIGVASLVAVPFAWYMMDGWLDSFPYSISVRPTNFLVATLLLMLVAALIIMVQSIKPMRANPVDTLKEE
jgi:putative ABC transport system permease protein